MIKNRDVYKKCFPKLCLAQKEYEDLELVLSQADCALLHFVETGDKKLEKEFVEAMTEASLRYGNVIAYFYECFELANT